METRTVPTVGQVLPNDNWALTSTCAAALLWIVPVGMRFDDSLPDGSFGPFFGVVDTVNPETTGPVSATWLFDISGSSNLAVSIDVGAMGDFESADSFELSASIDGGPSAPVLSLVADEAASHDYTLANGTVVTLADPLKVGSVELSNVLQTVSGPVVGSGNKLALTFTASADGGSEAVAFRNLVVSADNTPPEPDLQLIHDIQGSGSSVAITGPVEVQGIVTSLLERDDALDGFFAPAEHEDPFGGGGVTVGVGVFFLNKKTF